MKEKIVAITPANNTIPLLGDFPTKPLIIKYEIK